MKKDFLLNLLRNDYLKYADKDEKKNHYSKLGEISYLNIKKKGINTFRKSSDGCGLGYSDAILLDATVLTSGIKRLIIWFLNTISFNRIFEQQKIISRRLFDDRIRYSNFVFSKNKNVLRLLKKYKIKNSTEFGCDNVFRINNQLYSTYYLELCNKIDFINSLVNLKKVNTYCEIGGGFGANIHLIIQNYKNIRKILLIDIFPAIYIATKYLEKFYGKSVITYNKIINMKNISFKNDNSLEIICIPTWEIDRVKIKIDHFHNADSFSHLGIEKIKKYAQFLMNNSTKVFSITENDISKEKKYKTTNPKKFIKLFNDKVKTLKNNFIIEGLRKNKNIFYIGEMRKN